MEPNTEEMSRLVKYAGELGINVKELKENFSTRFKLQKLAFLLRVLNNDSTKDFNLYTHGPYSPNETCGYYDYANSRLKINEYEIDPEHLEKLKPIFQNKNDKIVEGAATVIYLIYSKSADWKDIYKKLKGVKPNLSITEIGDSIDLAKEFFLTNELKEEIMKEALEEQRAWENASIEDINSSL